MDQTFDPYHHWLGIPPDEQPASYYRLLGLRDFEHNPTVIDSAADRQMAFVRTFQSGKHGAVSQEILNELSTARRCLLNAPSRGRYDAKLRARAEVPLAQPQPTDWTPLAQTPPSQTPPTQPAHRTPPAQPAHRTPPTRPVPPGVLPPVPMTPRPDVARLAEQDDPQPLVSAELVEQPQSHDSDSGGVSLTEATSPSDDASESGEMRLAPLSDEESPTAKWRTEDDDGNPFAKSAKIQPQTPKPSALAIVRESNAPAVTPDELHIAEQIQDRLKQKLAEARGTMKSLRRRLRANGAKALAVGMLRGPRRWLDENLSRPLLISIGGGGGALVCLATAAFLTDAIPLVLAVAALGALFGLIPVAVFCYFPTDKMLSAAHQTIGEQKAELIAIRDSAEKDATMMAVESTRAQQNYLEKEERFHAHRQRLLQSDWDALRDDELVEFVAALLRDNGYDIEPLAAKTSPHGVDLIASRDDARIAVAVHGVSADAAVESDVDAVDEAAVRGALSDVSHHPAARAALVTNHAFSAEAVKLADQHDGCRLIGTSDMESLIYGKLDL